MFRIPSSIKYHLWPVVYACAFTLVGFSQQRVSLLKFPLSAVQLLDSPFLAVQQTDKPYLLALDPDRLLAPYLLEAGLLTTAER